MECARCFYLDRRLKISRPSMPGFSLNNAVDALLKNEFDLLRKSGESHELMKKYKIDAVPMQHPDLGVWRDDVHRYVGASVLHKPTNLMIQGIIDDVWKDSKGKMLMVDYKATSTTKEISLEDKYKQGYKRQIEIYQWIFRTLGHEVSDIGYFVFANATKNREKFDGKLEFDMTIISHKGDTSWVEPTITKIKACLMDDAVPPASETCEYCSYADYSSSF